MAARSRKRVGTVPVRVEMVQIRVLVSFNNLRAGDVGFTEMDDQIQGWADAGFVEILSRPVADVELTMEVDDGEGEAGPGEPQQDVPLSE